MQDADRIRPETPAQRLELVARLLAEGVRRLHARAAFSSLENLSQISLSALDLKAKTSVTVSPGSVEPGEGEIE